MPILICTYDQFQKIRGESSADYPAEMRDRVLAIIEDVRLNGDSALRKYTQMFDGVKIEQIAISPADLEAARGLVAPELLAALRGAAGNIEKFHRRQLREDWREEGQGIIVGQRHLPLQRVGAYVPGGTAVYPSSVLMTVIPARVAGVKEIFVCTPPGRNGQVDPLVLAAACEAGATEVFRVGGVQALAALAYGTETIPRVQKIVGPGNVYVTLAKKELYGQVGIDMLAGPSEIVIVADERAEASFIAADLLAQAEHDPLSKAILITNSAELANKVKNELETQLLSLSRTAVASRSLREQGAAIVVSALEEAWAIVNDLAPEHLELQVDNPWQYLDRIENAGSVFLGPYSPGPLGDYWIGTNHVLPTGSAARYASALGVDDFIKRSQLICCQAEALAGTAAPLAALARAEGFEAHARAVLIRGNDDETPVQG